MKRVLRTLERLYGRVTGGERADTREATPDGGATPAEGGPELSSELYHCPGCDTVFVAEDKRTCGTCGTRVEELHSTVPDASRR